MLLEFEKQVDKEQKHLHIAVLFDVLNLRFAWANILVNKLSKARQYLDLFKKYVA